MMAVGALPTNSANARVVLHAQALLRGLAATPPDFCVEARAVALADGAATLRADLAVELAAIFVAGSGAATLGGLGAGARAGLAALACLGRRLLIGLAGGAGRASEFIRHGRLFLSSNGFP